MSSAISCIRNLSCWCALKLLLIWGTQFGFSCMKKINPQIIFFTPSLTSFLQAYINLTTFRWAIIHRSLEKNYHSIIKFNSNNYIFMLFTISHLYIFIVCMMENYHINDSDSLIKKLYKGCIFLLLEKVYMDARNRHWNLKGNFYGRNWMSLEVLRVVIKRCSIIW